MSELDELERFDEDDEPAMSREVRDIIEPVKLTEKDGFQFRCMPGISCFNECCGRIEIVLTPYDILRLRKRLGLSPEEFLFNYAEPRILEKGALPVPLLLMDSESGKCPFNRPEGCTVYEDRPAVCRYYPIGMAFMHQEESPDTEAFYFLIKEHYCKGHEEDCRQNVGEWRAMEGVDEYDEMNRGWLELILKRRSMGPFATLPPQIAEFFYMASTNPDAFRRFVFESTFLKRYKVEKDTLERIQGDDLALFQFACDWLKSALFGDGLIKPQDSAHEVVTARRKGKGQKKGRKK